ncbi:MAG: exo-alpha-sialidase [Victivallales bacterium]
MGQGNQAPFTAWVPETPFPAVSDLQLPSRISHIMIHRSDSDFQFLHESSIVKHRNSFFVAWNNSPAGESEKGSVVRWIRSDDDFASWSVPGYLAPPIDHETTIWESCQLLSKDDVLWAFVGKVHSQPRCPEISGGRMDVFRFDDATKRWHQQGHVEKFHPLNRPQQLKDGSWIMGGQFNLVQPRVAICQGEDFSKWDVSEIPSVPKDRIDFAETSLSLGDGVVTAYVRSAVEAAYVSESRDGGRNWSKLRISNFPMSSAKTCAGTLSTGQHYLAFNMKPDVSGGGDRDVLAVAVSSPGEQLFRKVVMVRNGRSPKARRIGYCKGEQWSYPSVLEHDRKVYISYSVTKEDCCLSILPLEEFAI